MHALFRRFRVLRLDMRGHGGSGPVAGDYTMRALADDVARALEMLSLPRVHYIGLSIGGYLMCGQLCGSFIVSQCRYALSRH